MSRKVTGNPFAHSVQAQPGFQNRGNGILNYEQTNQRDSGNSNLFQNVNSSISYNRHGNSSNQNRKFHSGAIAAAPVNTVTSNPFASSNASKTVPSYFNTTVQAKSQVVYREQSSLQNNRQQYNSASDGVNLDFKNYPIAQPHSRTNFNPFAATSSTTPQLFPNSQNFDIKVVEHKSSMVHGNNNNNANIYKEGNIKVNVNPFFIGGYLNNHTERLSAQQHHPSQQQQQALQFQQQLYNQQSFQQQSTTQHFRSQGGSAAVMPVVSQQALNSAINEAASSLNKNLELDLGLSYLDQEMSSNITSGVTCTNSDITTPTATLSSSITENSPKETTALNQNIFATSPLINFPEEAPQLGCYDILQYSNKNNAYVTFVPGIIPTFAPDVNN